MGMSGTLNTWDVYWGAIIHISGVRFMNGKEVTLSQRPLIGIWKKKVKESVTSKIYRHFFFRKILRKKQKSGANNVRTLCKTRKSIYCIKFHFTEKT